MTVMGPVAMLTAGYCRVFANDHGLVNVEHECRKLQQA